jgi:hypothetical protein
MTDEHPVPEQIKQALNVLRDMARLRGPVKREGQRKETYKRLEFLRIAELAASRSQRIYFQLAAMIVADFPEHVTPWLTQIAPSVSTTKVLRKIGDALDATEKDIDRAGFRVVRSFLLALLEHLGRDAHELSLSELLERGETLKVEQIRSQYRKAYPSYSVPEGSSLVRTLRRRGLWPFKPGKPGRPRRI